MDQRTDDAGPEDVIDLHLNAKFDERMFYKGFAGDIVNALTAAGYSIVRTPKPAGKTVRVRIAACVDRAGEWSAYATSIDTDDDAIMGEAAEHVGSGEARYWITADLPIPEVVEVAGTVEAE